MAIRASHADELMSEIKAFMILAALTTPPGNQRVSLGGAGLTASGDGRRIDVTQIYPAIAQVVRSHVRDGESTRVLLFASADDDVSFVVK